MELLKDNYLRPFGHGDNFKVDIDPPKSKNLDYFFLCKQLAESVHEKKIGKLYLLYSGGLDSEYILSIFLSLKIEIVPVIIRLMPYYNEHDIRYAYDFCTSKKLKPLIIDVDFNKFVQSNKILEIATEYKIGAYQLPCTFHILEKIDGTIIMGSHGNPHMAYDSIDGLWYVDEYEPIHTLLEFFRNKNLYGCPFFLVHSPEQYLAFLLDKNMQKLANNFFPGKLGNNSTKFLVYNQGNDFNLKNRKKYTGYENIEKSEIFQHPNLQFFKDQGKKWWGIYRVEYNQMIQRLTK